MIQATLITLPVQTALVTDANICIAVKDNVLEEAPRTADFKWIKDKICVNADCPYVRTTTLTVDKDGLGGKRWLSTLLEDIYVS